MQALSSRPAERGRSATPFIALNVQAIAFAAAGFGFGVMVGRDASVLHQTVAAAGAATAYAQPLFFGSLALAATISVWLGIRHANRPDNAPDSQ